MLQGVICLLSGAAVLAIARVLLFYVSVLWYPFIIIMKYNMNRKRPMLEAQNARPIRMPNPHARGHFGGRCCLIVGATTDQNAQI
jgi:hypothetical protein